MNVTLSQIQSVNYCYREFNSNWYHSTFPKQKHSNELHFDIPNFDYEQLLLMTIRFNTHLAQISWHHIFGI